MNGHHDLRSAGDALPYALRADDTSVEVNVGEDRDRVEREYAGHGADVRHGSRDHLVALRHTQGTEGRVQRGRAGRDHDHVHDAERLRHGLLELVHLAARSHQSAGLDDLFQ